MTGPVPHVAAVRSAVRRGTADVPAGSLVLVACSGGADSLALAAALAFVAPRAGVRAGAVVVDHRWHPGSAAVAAAAAAQCTALGLDPVEVVAVDAATTTGGPEAAARADRYAALERAAQRLGAAAVLLGHTLDDQAETVLLGLARGSGTRSLSGMPATRGIFRRPLLGLPRDEVHASCLAEGLQPWSDPTNSDPAFARARVRTDVLPVVERELGPGVARALARTALQLRADAEVLDELADAALERAAVAGADGVHLRADVLARDRDAVRWRVLRAAAVRAGAPAGSLSHRHVLAVDALLVDWHGQGPVHLPGRVTASRACGRLALARRPEDGKRPTTPDEE